jgi:hypothetical protein
LKKYGRPDFPNKCDTVASNMRSAVTLCTVTPLRHSLSAVVRHTVLAVRRNCTTKSAQSITWVLCRLMGGLQGVVCHRFTPCLHVPWFHVFSFVLCTLVCRRLGPSPTYASCDLILLKETIEFDASEREELTSMMADQGAKPSPSIVDRSDGLQFVDR